MSKHLMRLYHNLEFDEIKQHTLEYGALSGICSKCKELSIKIDMTSCPKCGTEFKYIAIQNIREHLPKMARIMGERQGVYFIDHQDYKRIEGEQKARSLLG